MRPGILRGSILFLFALTLAVVAYRAGSSPAQAEPAPAKAAPRGSAGHERDRDRAPDPRTAGVRELDERIRQLRQEFHSQLDPLEAQIVTLRAKYDPQIQSLEDQRKALVEQNKPGAIQELDRQEAAELASLAEQEKSDLEKTRQHYADARKELKLRYDEKRKQVMGDRR